MQGKRDITLIGAGLAGSLMAVFLARRGLKVTVYERNCDMRHHEISAGRSINLALAHRGMRALDAVGLLDQVRILLVPMRGRMLHAADGKLTLTPYGRTPSEVIYSVSRPGLNRLLMDAAEQAGVQLRFNLRCEEVDFESAEIHLSDEIAKQSLTVAAPTIIAADGAGSAVRRAMSKRLGTRIVEDILPHGYKELSIPAGSDCKHQMEREALHIWPRGGHMLIALPNLDGSFTATLFLANKGSPSFAMLNEPAELRAFFRNNFPDALALLPDLEAEFYRHPTGVMGTVHCTRWRVGGRLLLLGDAAHAIVPFHGQGMNCAFEDCLMLDRCIEAYGQDWDHVFAGFETQRRADTDAIATMALENYVEMRDVVRTPKFLLQKSLGFKLEERHPGIFVPRYSMVMFHDLPYSEAQRRGAIQQEILDALTDGADSLDKISFARADQLIEHKLGSSAVIA